MVHGMVADVGGFMRSNYERRNGKQQQEKAGKKKRELLTWNQ